MRRIHDGVTPEAEIQAMEVAFHKIAKELKERQTVADSFASAGGVQVAVPGGGNDDAGAGGGLDDAVESEGEDNVGIAAIQITADAVLGPEETAGTSSGDGTAGRVPTVIPIKRPSSSLQTPSDSEFEEYFLEQGAVLAGKPVKSSTPRSSPSWIADSDSSRAASDGEESEKDDAEAVHKSFEEDDGSEGSEKMEVDEEVSATNEVVAGDSMGGTELEVPRTESALATQEGKQLTMDTGNNNGSGSVDNEYAVLPGQQNLMAIGI